MWAVLSLRRRYNQYILSPIDGVDGNFALEKKLT